MSYYPLSVHELGQAYVFHCTSMPLEMVKWIEEEILLPEPGKNHLILDGEHEDETEPCYYGVLVIKDPNKAVLFKLRWSDHLRAN